jgi:hypothetical protein|tara:strand:- start:231 stop:500 length:270 start_codon:yes stop_codon:yes gene_type:complete
MPETPSNIIKTISELSFDGLLKVMLAAALAFFFWNEYAEDQKEQQHEAGTDILFRDLLVAIRSEQGKSNTHEELQDLKIKRNTEAIEEL